MAFKQEWGVKGLWVGICATYIVNFVFLQFIIMSVNWPITIQKSAERREKEKELARLNFAREKQATSATEGYDDEYVKVQPEQATERSNNIEDRFIRPDNGVTRDTARTSE